MPTRDPFCPGVPASRCALVSQRPGVATMSQEHLAGIISLVIPFGVPASRCPDCESGAFGEHSGSIILQLIRPRCFVPGCILQSQRMVAGSYLALCRRPPVPDAKLPCLTRRRGQCSST